jgi:hypothetical protein
MGNMDVELLVGMIRENDWNGSRSRSRFGWVRVWRGCGKRDNRRRISGVANRRG